MTDSRRAGGSALRSFGASFSFAFEGLVAGARRDRNLRVQLASGVLVGTLVALGHFEPAEEALLLACAAAVLALESLNTAIENSVDLAAVGTDERAGMAKDAAAGAVLAGALGSVLVLLALSLPRVGELVLYISTRVAGAVGGVVAAAAAGLLPWRRAASRGRDVQLFIAGVAGLVALWLQARSQLGTVLVGSCLTISIAAAFRKPRSAQKPSAR